MFDKIIGLFKRKNVIETKALVSVSPGDTWHSVVLGTAGPVSSTLAMEIYKENSAVATSVDMISTAIESMSLVIQNKETKEMHGGTYAKNLLRFLDQPNGFETRNEVIGRLTRHYLLTADAYVYLVGFDIPAEMYAITPSLVNYIPHPDGYPGGYRISAYKGSGKDFNRETKDTKFTRYLTKDQLTELYHIMGYCNDNDTYQGTSVLEAIAEDVRQQIAGRIHNKKLLENGATPSLAVVFQDETPPPVEEQKQRQKVIDEKLKGYNNAGKIATFSSKDLKIEKLTSSTNKDMDYVNLDEISSKSVYRRYGIPLPLVDTSGATFSNVESSIPYFYHQTVLPVADKIFSNLSKLLCPRFKLDPKVYHITYDINDIDVLRTYQLEQLKLREEIGIETINELRRSLSSREDLEDGNKLPTKKATEGGDKSE